jgi:hypothetical protein
MRSKAAGPLGDLPALRSARPSEFLMDQRMPHAQLTETVRRLIAATFVELGIGGDHELVETILIRAGAYCGRRFETSGGHAIWFVEENQIKFYRADGSVVGVVDPAAAALAPARMAA